MRVERIGLRADLDPFAAAGEGRHCTSCRDHPHIALQLRHVFPGRVEVTGVVFEAKLMPPRAFSEEAPVTPSEPTIALAV